jgi:hypothetical protein
MNTGADIFHHVNLEVVREEQISEGYRIPAYAYWFSQERHDWTATFQ